MDDMVDTAGTLVKAAQVLKEEGAKKVVAYCTHAVLSGPAVERIAASDLDELVVTDTIPVSAEKAKGLPGLKVLDYAEVAKVRIKKLKPVVRHVINLLPDVSDTQIIATLKRAGMQLPRSRPRGSRRGSAVT
jgi:hypothetical protein